MRKRDELSDPNSCLNKADDDEMLFVLRTRDETAPDTIREWIKKRIERGYNNCDDKKIIEAEQCAALMEAEHRKYKR